jgi:predicted Fe-Mo cluster-binding NifX family protein/ferredoxin
MKIAVTSTGPNLDDKVEARFGRCAYFLIVDPDTMAFEAFENPNIASGGGAGLQSAQLMAERGVEIVLTGNCGPNAFQVFGAAGIQVIVGVSGIVRKAIEKFKSGGFSSASAPSVASHFGMGITDPSETTPNPQSMLPPTGGGMGGGFGKWGGRGMGRGGGRGMGRGMGMSGSTGAGMMGVPPADPTKALSGSPQQPGLPMSGEQELEMLRAQAHAMEEQVRTLKARISEVEEGTGKPGLMAVVNSDKCTACSICQEICPTGAISVEEIARIDREKCTGCGECVANCPQEAISLTKA